MPREGESDFSTDVLLDVLFKPKWSALNTSCSYMNDTNGLNRVFLLCVHLCVYACNNNNLRKSRRGHWRNGRWEKKNGNVVNTVLIYEILKNLSNKKSDCKHQIDRIS